MRQLPGWQFIHHLRCCQLLGAVHAHVQGALVQEAETTLRVLQLITREAQIEEDASDCCEAVLPRQLDEISEVAMNRGDRAGPLFRQLTRRLNGALVLVERQQPAARLDLLQQPAAVAAGAEGAVDEDSTRQGLQESY